MNYFCTTCSFKLASKLSFDKHVKTKRHIARLEETLEKSYKCLCGKIFTAQTNLYRHRRKCEIYIQSKNQAGPLLTQETEKESNENINNKSIKTNLIQNETVSLGEFLMKNMIKRDNIIQDNNDQIRILHEKILSEKTKENQKLQQELQSARATIKDLKLQIGYPTNGKTCRRHLPKQHRRNIIESQQNKCNTCSSELSDYYEIDHIIAMQFGGTDELNNLQALCCECHARKSRTENKKRQQIKDAIYAIIYGNQNQEDNIQTVLSTTP